MFHSENVTLEKPLLYNIRKEPKKKNKEFFWVYQVLMIYPDQFNYVVISSSPNKDLAIKTLKDLRNRNIKAKIEVVNYNDTIIDSFT